MSITSRQLRGTGRDRSPAIALTVGDQPAATTLPLAIGFGLLRALAATAAGLILACGVGVLIWAVTPGSPDAGALVRGAIAAFGAANFLPPSIDGIRVTATPLLLSAVCFGAVASAGNLRFGRRAPLPGMPAQLLVAVLTGVAYGAFTSAAVAALAPPGAAAERVERPIAFGVVAAVAGLTLRGKEFRRAFRSWARLWLRGGLRAGAAACALIAAGGAITLTAGLVRSFGTATDLASTAPGFGDGVGMLLLGLGYLPNALVAGIGYSSGVGFLVGGGSYSPLGSAGAELPGLPLLAAVPTNAGVSWLGLLSTLFPLAAGLLAGWLLTRTTRSMTGRLLGAAVAAVVVAAVCALLAAVAGGGIEGSSWARLTVPWWSGLLLGGVVGVLAAAVGGVGVLTGRVGAAGGSGSSAAASHLTEPIAAVADEPAGDGDAPAAEPAGSDEPAESAEPAASDEPAESAESAESAARVDADEPAELAADAEPADVESAAAAERPEPAECAEGAESPGVPDDTLAAADAKDGGDPAVAEDGDAATAEDAEDAEDAEEPASADVTVGPDSADQLDERRTPDPTDGGRHPAH